MSQFIFWYIFLDKLLIIYILVCIFIVIPYYYIPYSLFKQTKKKRKRKIWQNKKPDSIYQTCMGIYQKENMIYLIAVN